MLGYLELFFGKSFTGKTARALWEVRAVPRLIVVDPKCGQLVNLKGYQHLWPQYAPGKFCGWLTVDEYGREVDSVVDYFRPLSGNKKPFRVVIHMREHFREQLELLCILLRPVGRVTLFVDELGLFIPSRAGNLPPAITSAMISGRHEGLYFVGTAQRPSLVHTDARANAERMRWYRITLPHDLEAAREYMPRALADSLPTLPDYVCIETTDGGVPFRDESMVGKIKILGKSPHVVRGR